MKRLIVLTSIISMWAGAFDASARYRGDLNGDDRVDLADMVYLAKAIKAGSTDKALDINASGSVDDYDLQRLADIIISGSLTEDSGLNVGIGGWDDAGEDFGGTVKAPAFNTRSEEDIRFYMRNPKSEGNGCYSMEFGVSEGNEAPSAILFNVRLPREMSFDISKIVELDPALPDSHKLYGTPRFVKENENDEWSDYSLRFILFSPDLTELPFKTGRLGKVYYSVGECWGEPFLRGCQIVSSNGGCHEIPEHGGGYWGNFIPVEVASIWFDTMDIEMLEEDEAWLYANIEPWDATDQTIVWSSSDEQVASVYSEDGRNARITAISSGYAIISATASNGLSAICNVTVMAREIEMWDILLDVEALELEVGDSYQLVATVYPSETTDPSLEWWSDDESVVFVDQDGYVTMVGEGSTTVHVRSVRWPHIEAICRIDVSAGVEGINEGPTCDIFTSNGTLIKSAVPSSDIQNLDKGFYLIRQRGKTIKILK